MGTEIEVKVRVESHGAVRERLRAMGGMAVRGGGVTLETNTFFDTAGGGLRASDQGLRIRRNQHADGEELVVTYKGPKTAGAYKSREEIEVGVDDYDALVALFGRLGYGVTLSFQKRRETWRVVVPGGAGGGGGEGGEAEVVLDEPAKLGTFVEVEAGSEGVIGEVLRGLGLEGAAQVRESYIQLISEWVERHAPGTRAVEF